MSAVRKLMPHEPQAVQRAKNVPGGRYRATPQYGGHYIAVKCSDRKDHRYLNQGVPEETLPMPAYAACPQCGHATALIIGTVGVICEECKADNLMEYVGAFEADSGVQLTSKTRHTTDYERARQGKHKALRYIGQVNSAQS